MSKARDLADLGNAYSDGALSNRNMIINGAMQVAQRGTSVAGLSGANSYKTVDRYTTYISSLGTWTQSQDTDAPSGFGHSLKMLCTTADASPASTNRMLIQTKIEGQDVQSLGFGDTSNTYTVSFYVKSNVTGTYILEQYGDTASDTGNNISTAYTVDTADTWERKTITLNVDSGAMTADNTSGLVLSFWLGTGSNYSSGTLNTSWSVPSAGDRAVGQVNIASDINNYWQITGVQLEVGDTATPFEHRSYGDELARCKRYYERYDDTGTGQSLCAGMWYDSTNVYGPLLFEVEKRTNPTFSYNTSGSYEAYRAGTNSLTSTVSVSRTTVHGTRINLSGLSGSGTAGQGSWIEIDGNGYLVFDAEL